MLIDFYVQVNKHFLFINNEFDHNWNTFFYSILMGLILTTIFIISLIFVIYIVQSPSIQKQFQDILLNLLNSKYYDERNDSKVQNNDIKIFIAKDLDTKIEAFINRLLNKFIDSWYSNISDNKSFQCSLKLEIALAIRNLAKRCKHVSITFINLTDFFF